MGTVSGSIDGTSGILVSDPVAVAGDTGAGIGVCGASSEWLGVAGYSLLYAGVLGFGHAAGVIATGTVRGLIAKAGSTAVPEGSAAIEASCNLGAGVYANSITDVGVYAYSVENSAVYATSGGGDAVRGFAQGRGTAIVGESVKGLAGAFHGPVQIDGDLTVFGAKSAAVKHKTDGKYRTFYALEAPESWLEDFGDGELRRGKAKVRMDKEFAGCVLTQDYHVFLTPKGECNGLFVAEQGFDGFMVRELGHGKSDVRFSYRIVARRGDLEVARLVKALRTKPSRAPKRPQSTKLTKDYRPRTAKRSRKASLDHRGRHQSGV